MELRALFGDSEKKTNNQPKVMYTKCPECGNPNILWKNEELKCEDCGLIIYDKMMEYGCS